MAGRAFVLLYAHDTPLYRGLQMAERRVQQFAYTANRIGRSMLTVATAAGAPLAFSARTFANFQDVMLEVKAVTGATGQQFDQLYEKAKRLGATTSFTASQVGEGMANLGRQGFKPAEIDAAIPAVLNLARGTKTELGVAATIAAGTLRAFSMEATEMTRVADVLTATANNSSQTLEELGDTMKYAAPIADEMGLSIEQTAKAVGVLANMQIKGTMAGTALRKIMGDLANEETQAKLRKYHVEVLDLVDGGMRPLGDVMVDLGQAMAKMTDAGRISFAQELFGERAYGAALKLSKGGFEDLSAAIDNAGGVAQRTADLMDSGLGGVLRILMSAIEGVQIAIGEALETKLKAWGTTAIEIAGKVQEWVKAHQDLVVTVAEIIAGLAAFAVAAIAVGSVAGSIAATINVVSLAVGGLSTAMAFIAANPLVVLAAGFISSAAAIAYFESTAQRLPSVMSEVREQSDKMRAADQALFRELQALSEKQQLTNSEMGKATSIVDTLEGRYGDLGVTVDQASGKIEGMAGAQEKLNEAMKRATISQLRAEIQAGESEIALMEQERYGEAPTKGEIFNPRKFVMGIGSLFVGEEEMLRQDAAARDRINAERAKVEALRQRIVSLQGGDDKAIVGGPIPPATGGANEATRSILPPPSAAEESKSIEEIRRMRERMLQSLAALQRELIEDEHEREIANIHAQYDEETKRLIELRKSRTDFTQEELQGMVDAARAIGEARNQAIANAQARRDEQKREATQRIEGELARVKIEKESNAEIDKAKASGASLAEIKALELERDKKLLELDRQRELQQANKEGLDPAVVNELYDARLAMAEQQASQDRFADIRRGQRALRDAALAPTAGVGSLEAYQAFARNASSDPAQRIREKQLRKLDDIDRNTQRAADAAEGFGVIEVGIDLSD